MDSISNDKILLFFQELLKESLERRDRATNLSEIEEVNGLIKICERTINDILKNKKGE